MTEVFVLGGGTPTPTEFRPGSPKTVNHQTPKSPQEKAFLSCHTCIGIEVDYP